MQKDERMKKVRICTVCGKPFPQGQGVVIVVDERLQLNFHSNRCASKFLRRLVEDNLADSNLRRAVDQTARAFREEVEKKISSLRKKIA